MMLNLRWLIVLLFLAPMVPSRDQVDVGSSLETAPRTQTSWWTLSDADFVNQYGNLATGTQQQQSRFAWMVFARANQQIQSGAQKSSQWELWPSDPDTFAPNVARFEAARKIRTRPHVEPLQQLRLISHRREMTALEQSQPPMQEVTRNPLSYNYIMDNHLNTQAGIAAYFNEGKKIEFPLGVVETKAAWVRGAIPGTRQFGGFSLTGLHLMVKVKPTPQNPFTDNSPSWFWTTFEFKSNPGLAHAQTFISYKDAIPPAESAQLMSDAGLANTVFVNYVTNGTQIQFDDAQFKSIIQGNTQLEFPFATPPNLNPSTWTSWSSSCHTCHGQASGKVQGSGVNSFNFTFTGPIGPLAGSTLPSAEYHPYDFVWALQQAR